MTSEHTSCDHCGIVYNPRLGDRFWTGPFAVDGELFTSLCDDCRRDLIGDREAAVDAKAAGHEAVVEANNVGA